jgi:hypothetical protein
MAALNGLPEYPFAILPHPIADNDEATLLAKAEAVAGEVARLLTGRPESHPLDHVAGPGRPV